MPEPALGNTEERLAERLAPLARRGLLPVFPLGTDFDADEQRLVSALLWLKKSSRLGLVSALLGSRALPQDLSALARMGLAEPQGIRERLLRQVVALGLRRTQGPQNGALP